MDIIKKLFVRKLTAKERLERKKIERRIKIAIQYFFGGLYDENGYPIQEPIVDIPISQLGITGLNFNHTNDIPKGSPWKGKIILTIVLSRPGLIIGKGGQTIDTLQKYVREIDDYLVDVKIEESDIWK
jgi:hypothetical protein